MASTQKKKNRQFRKEAIDLAKRRPSGDGMVRKREDGRWEGRIVIGHKENGNSIFRYIYADTQKELTVKLRQNITAYQGVDLTEDCKMTLSDWLDRWLEQMALVLRPSTLDHYRSDLAHHVKPYLGRKKLTQVTPADLQEALRHTQRAGPGASPPRPEPRTLHHHRPRHPHHTAPRSEVCGRPAAASEQPR